MPPGDSVGDCQVLPCVVLGFSLGEESSYTEWHKELTGTYWASATSQAKCQVLGTGKCRVLALESWYFSRETKMATYTYNTEEWRLHRGKYRPTECVSHSSKPFEAPQKKGHLKAEKWPGVCRAEMKKALQVVKKSLILLLEIPNFSVQGNRPMCLFRYMVKHINLNIFAGRESF